MVISIMLHGCDTSALVAKTVKRIQAFDMEYMINHGLLRSTSRAYNDFILSWRDNATASRHQRRQYVGDSWRCSCDS